MNTQPTSKAGHEHIKPHKPTHREKILEALMKLKGGATQEELAAAAGMRPDQVWKRLSEMERDEEIFNTGVTRKLKSGVNGIVWQVKRVCNKKFVTNNSQLKLL